MRIDTSVRSANMSFGRPSGPPNMIVIHHWGIDGQRFDNVARYLARANGNTSAHYVVQEGRVSELVSPDNRAWHAGAKGNPRGIGIECRPECTKGDREQVAELVAYLFKRYGVMPVKQHKDFMSTDCAGRWGAYLSWIRNRALEINAWASANTAKPGKLTVDGVISSQPKRSEKYLPGFTAVEYVSRNAQGSRTVKALQEFLNTRGAKLEVDGIAGPLTVKALQGYIGVTADGYAGKQTVSTLQRVLNNQGAKLEVDGIAGPLTVKALQTWLNNM